MPAEVAGPDSVLWDVVEEHLDELEYQLSEIDRAFERPLLTLEQLAAGPEELAVAHLDALLVGGAPVVTRLVEGCLEDPTGASSARVTAAAAVVLGAGRRDLFGRLLFHEEAAVRGAAARGSLWAGNAELDRSLLSRLAAPSLPPAELAGLLEAVAVRALAPPPLLAWVQSEDPAVSAAAARAVRGAAPNLHLAVTEYLAQEHPDAQVRDAALLAGLAWGSPAAWRLCGRRALDPDRADEAAMTLYALLGDPGHHQQLLGLRGRDSHRLAVIRALGHSGSAALVPALLEHVASKDVAEARWATLAIATITGLDLDDASLAVPPAPPPQVATLPPAAQDPEARASLPPLEEDDLDADLIPGPEAVLPVPDAAAIRAWWDRHATRMTASHRLIAGQVFSPDALLATLGKARLSVRHPLAWGLAIRWGGRSWVETRAPSAVQRAQLQAIRTLGPRFPPNPLSRW